MQRVVSLWSVMSVVTRRFRLITSTTAAIILFYVFLEVTYHHNGPVSTPVWSFMSSHENSSLGVVAAGSVDWSEFAYVQYVTDSDYLCNSVMIFEALQRFASRPDRLIMYPSSMMAANASLDNSDDARLLIKARDEYNVRLRPVEVQYRSGSERKSNMSSTYSRDHG